MDFGFSHCYHLHLSLLPWHLGSFSEKVDTAYQMMRRAGATSFRPHVHWNRVQPLIMEPELRIQNVTESMIRDYTSGKQGVYWEETDMMIKGMADNGLKPFLCLAAAYMHQVPLAQVRKGIVRLDSGPVSDENYLGNAYLHARTVVRRYKGYCNRWQLENELCGSVSQRLLYRWRRGNRWLSARFRDKLLETLHRAVKEEDPSAQTSHNFCFDFSSTQERFDWRTSIRRWHKYMDIIGFDPFPNYLRGQPIKIREQMKRGADQIRSLGYDSPLYILEDGIPVLPTKQGFSEQVQADYMKELLDSAEENKLDGVFYYCFTSQEGAPGNEWHKTLPMHVIEDWWGMIRADGSTRPAYDYLVKRCAGKTGLGKQGG